MRHILIALNVIAFLCLWSIERTHALILLLTNNIDFGVSIVAVPTALVVAGNVLFLATRH